MPESHLFDEYRNRNLYDNNLPMKDHHYQMPTSGVQNQDLQKANDLSPNKMNQIVKPKFANNVKINTQQHSNFEGTYNSIFTAKSSEINPLTK